MSPEPARQHYVARVIDLYCALPDTTGRARPADRRLAAALCDRGIRLEIIEDALLLASVRRSLRAPDALPLAPVRSLHYFLGVIDELLQTPLPAGYRHYLQRKLRNCKNRSSEPRPS